MNDDVLIQVHIAGNQSEKMLNSKQIALMLISALMCRFQELLLRCKKGLILHYFLRMQAKLMNFSPAASAFLIHTIFSFFSSQSKDVIIRQCFAFMYELSCKVALKLMRKSSFSKKKSAHCSGLVLAWVPWVSGTLRLGQAVLWEKSGLFFSLFE